jgi:alpha-beta hydrolase superfamily lysophospholipase
LGQQVGEYSIEEHQAGDGYRWRYRRYLAAEPVKARVIGVHGIQSHGGWYEQSCRYLSEAGFEVCFLDRRGAGLNQESRGDAPSFRRLLDDLAEFMHAEVKRYDSGLPTFCMAISWGGKLAIGLERKHPGLVDGLALLCPGFFPKVRPSLREGLGIALARLFSPRKLFPVPLNDPELFTANPRWQKFIQEDTLGLRQATARLLVESVRLGAYVRLSSVRIPVLLLLAENDRIIDNTRTRPFVEGFDSADKKIIQYPGAHHTLEFEPNPEMFFKDLLNWLEDHIATKP